jgi:putative redox protein
MRNKSEKVRFPGAHGAKLVGRLERPPGQTPRAYALFAHCFTCSKDLKAVGWLSRALVERGFAVLRFDFTGLGESEGDFADTNFSSNLDDLKAAVDFLRDRYEAPSLLIGHSLGGAAVLAIAGEIEEVRAVATVGAPSNTEHLRGTLLEAAPELEDQDEARVTLAGRTFKIKRQMLEDFAEDHVRRRLAALRKPLLILHSPVDEVVNIDHARRIYEAARHPKSFVSLDDANHLLTRERDARYAADVLAAWAGRYLDPEDEEERPAVDTGDVLVLGGPEGYRNEVYTNRHFLPADEPARIPGGTDTGPSPYELLLAALGTCTAMTLRMYADRKEWPLEGVRVRLHHEKIHAKDCADCLTETGKIDRIEKTLEVLGPLSNEQRERLHEIADRCPVHRTLTSETVIETQGG